MAAYAWAADAWGNAVLAPESWGENPADTTPDAFTFIDQTGISPQEIVYSSPITVAGLNAASPISVSGGEYSVDGGAYTGDAGSVVNGDVVRVRHTASASYSTAVSTVLTIGGVSDTFSSTTVAAPAVVDSGTGRKRDRRRRGFLSYLTGRG